MGAYSPLLDKDYYELTKDFGQLDDSFGRTKLNTEALKEKRALLDFLNVKYIVTDLELKDFRLLSKEAGKRIYLNENATGREFFIQTAAGTPLQPLLTFAAAYQTPLNCLVHVNLPNDGLLVRNQIYDKGWNLILDGKRTDLERAYGAFQGVRLSSGPHELRFYYIPGRFAAGCWVHLICMAFALCGAVMSVFYKK